VKDSLRECSSELELGGELVLSGSGEGQSTERVLSGIVVKVHFGQWNEQSDLQGHQPPHPTDIHLSILLE